MESFDNNVWDMMKEMGNYERHFNQLEHQYRVLASTWLLAVFAATGFLFSNDAGIPHRELATAFLGLAGAIGVSLIWALDIKVYHQLLEAYFVEALKLESENPWLPQSRANMWKEFCASGKGRPRNIGVLQYIRWFYVGGTIVPLSISVGGIMLFLKTNCFSTTTLIVSAGTGIVITALWGFCIHHKTDSPLLETMSEACVPSR